MKRVHAKVRQKKYFLIALVSLCSQCVFLATEAHETKHLNNDGTHPLNHAISMHGSPLYPSDFAYFPYVNPNAPKGGQVVLGQTGSFDTTNPFIIRGEPAAGIREYVFESLMARGLDEPFTMYALIAENIYVPNDRKSVTFYLNSNAKFSDDKPITADDVIYSMETLREFGRPNHRNSYKKVIKSEKIDKLVVKFTFDDSGDREMPLIMASMPVLPKHIFSSKTFDQTTLEPQIGSGPYVIDSVDPGRSITYRRNSLYWGKDLPVNRGRFNFDTIRFEYFRDSTSQFEDFKLGRLDLRTEDDPKLWAEGYNISSRIDGRITLHEIETGLPAGMSALAFNIRKSVFQDKRVRQALILLFNFEWLNKTLYHGLYKRTESYFSRSVLSSAGHPANPIERNFLKDYPNAVLPEIMEGHYRFPAGDDSVRYRQNAQEALSLLREAGYEIKGGALLNTETSLPFTFEIMASSTKQQKLINSFISDLSKIGIKARLRVVDSAQYQSRLKDFDYDMIQSSWPSSLSPGNEQVFRWDSRTADTPGSYNYVGVKNPAVDAMIKNLLAAYDEETFVSAVRALDRVLLSGHYVIPLFHASKQWVASWRQIVGPTRPPLWGFNLDSWWIVEENR
ncbi:MAG: extracellular solute-binding protein [Hyphomicrobium sp.]